MKLLIVNFAMDPMDPVLGFAVPWAEALADHFDDAHVLTGRRSPSLSLDRMRVTDVGWNPGHTPTNVVRLVWKFNRVLAQFRPSVVFVHMAASYAAIVGPIARARGVPLVLWYEHQATSWELRLAERWASAIVSASNSYPGTRTPLVVGHGIDTHLFAPRPRTNSRDGRDLVRAVHTGRDDPQKRVDRILSALQSARDRSAVDYSFTQIGHALRSPVPNESGQVGAVKRGWPSWARGVPSIPRSQLGDAMASYHFYVHARRGSLDKAPLEACLVGLPVLSEGDHVYRALGGIGPVPLLEDQLDQLMRMTARDVDRMVLDQQESVLRNHSLESTAHRIADILKAKVRS